MPGVTQEQIAAARRMSAIEFLQKYRPNSLVKSSARGEYQLAEHDSFKINAKSSLWHWKSRDIGGKSALNYLIYVELNTKEQKKEITKNVSNPIRTADEREQYRDLIRENIEYDILAKNNPADRIRLDELVELMLDTVCSKRSSIRIAGDEFPTEVVKSRFLKLEAQHIQYVLDSLKDNPPHIHNIKKYLLAALYNAPLTIENYYAAQINHDLYGRNRGDVNWK